MEHNEQLLKQISNQIRIIEKRRSDLMSIISILHNIIYVILGYYIVNLCFSDSISKGLSIVLNFCFIFYVGTEVVVEKLLKKSKKLLDYFQQIELSKSLLDCFPLTENYLQEFGKFSNDYQSLIVKNFLRSKFYESSFDAIEYIMNVARKHYPKTFLLIYSDELTVSSS